MAEDVVAGLQAKVLTVSDGVIAGTREDKSGAALADVVRTRIFVRDIADWEAVARAHGSVFGAVRPANTLVRAEPINPQMLVEIEVDAVIVTR